MTKEELKIWFWDKLNSCYPVEHKVYSQITCFCYDTNYIRSKKLGNILNKEVEYPTVIKGDCLFEIDNAYKQLWVSTDKIYDFLKEQINCDIEKLIKEFIKNTKYENLRIIIAHNYNMGNF
jgi:hypothetical protein